ncbi:hypothetical protein KOM00_19915 [Geomonas sp. Red69]|uniref:CoA-binding domain-containing protein n=1 Tax=Geomonas diazotrophica TaxID=2843197 RepID=A0ABX8JNR4_9BACT|nr:MULTISPECIES: hypothetical protein [Geomonas]MBU5638991.1 hypothetical protein [Geomonas diazotrophica]QWV98244.1 hypothetical protein KP005_02830 [Geomonas nitrogeniifigens]QXE87428.1 hypothetical protein KP003_03195 [Geomonas nitrogeniifigens]
MCIAVVGSEKTVGWGWMGAAARAGFDLRMVHPALVTTLENMEGVDALVIAPEGVSGEVQEQAVQIASARGIPSMCASCEAAPFCHGRGLAGSKN